MRRTINPFTDPAALGLAVIPPLALAVLFILLLSMFKSDEQKPANGEIPQSPGNYAAEGSR